jgi:hypothetical protein
VSTKVTQTLRSDKLNKAVNTAVNTGTLIPHQNPKKLKKAVLHADFLTSEECSALLKHVNKLVKGISEDLRDNSFKAVSFLHLCKLEHRRSGIFAELEKMEFSDRVKTQVLKDLNVTGRVFSKVDIELDFFINLYDPGCSKGVSTRKRKASGEISKIGMETGMDAHFDEMGIYGAFVCNLTGDGDTAGLYWCPTETTKVPLIMEAGDCAFLKKGCLHGVEILLRTSKRVTFNVFVRAAQASP